MYRTNLLTFFCFFLFNYLCNAESKKDFPYYEEYLQKSDFRGFINDAKEYLDKNQESTLAPRLAHDLMIVGKAANDVDAIKKATSLLLFTYPKSLPSVNFISSFERGSPRFTELLKAKVDEGDLKEKDFAVSFCRAMLFISRAQGPDLLTDKSLRLRVHLLAQKAGVEEILLTTQKIFNESAKENSTYGRLVKILISEQNNLQKIKEISAIGGKDANFCVQFLLAQLNEKESKSEQMATFRINQAIFSKSPNPSLALKLISKLPKQKQNTAKIQFIKSIALHFDERSDDAINNLKKIASSKQHSKQWKEWAKSFSDGLQSKTNRKTVLIDSLGKAFDLIDQERDALCFEVGYKTKQDEDYKFFIYFDKITPLMEIQVRKSEELQFAYRSTKESSMIFDPEAQNMVRFESSGALPIPKFSIIREIETGSFSYNFNLNFGNSFDELFREGASIMDNAYLSTPKGRSVLLNHILEKNVVWLGVPQKVKLGTSFPVLSYSEQKDTVSQSSISFDVEGRLLGLSIGNFNIGNIQTGSKDLLKKLPALNDFPVVKKEKFDFPFFMKILGDASKLVKN